MKERLRRLALVNEAGRAMSGILNLDELLDRILSLVDEVFEFANCAILLLDPTANELFILKARGYSPSVVRSFRAGPGQGITGACLETGEPIVVADVREDDRYIRGVPNARGEVAVPLVVDEQIIGVLDAETAQPEAMSQEDMDFLSIFASQAATAIHNARLHYQLALHAKVLEQRLEQMGGLLAACQILTEPEDFGEMTRSIFGAMVEAVPCDACSLLLLDRESGTLRQQMHLGPLLFEGDLGALPVGGGLLASALEDNLPAQVPSLAADPEPLDGFPTQGSAMAAPLARRGEVFGVVVAHRGLGDVPGEMDLAVFAGFVTLIGLHLTNDLPA